MKERGPRLRLWRYAVSHRRRMLLAATCSVLNKTFELAPLRKTAATASTSWPA